MKIILQLTTWLACAPLAAAQLKAGDAAPLFGAEFLNSPVRSLSEFRGQVLFVDFWRTWCVPCRKSVPHLNELNATYKDRGLVVVGVTNEPKDLVLQSIAKTKSEFLIALVQGDALDLTYGVTGYPHSYLIDAGGRVVWQGNPLMFDERKIWPLLEKVSVIPLLPPAYKEINARIDEKKLGEAGDLIERALTTAPEDAELLRAKAHVERGLATRLAQAKEAAEASDFGRAVDLYREVVDLYAGKDVVNDARRQISSIEQNPAAKTELAAHDQLRKGEDQLAHKQLKQAAATWKALIGKYPDTNAAKRAAALLRKNGMN